MEFNPIESLNDNNNDSGIQDETYLNPNLSIANIEHIKEKSCNI